MQQKLFQNFVTTRIWSFWNKIEKELQEPSPKLKKYLNIKYLRRIFALPAIQCKW